MKKRTVIMTVLLVMTVLFASCSNGGGSGEGEAAKAQAVKVSLALGGDVVEAAQKAIAVNLDADDFSYHIQTTPLWTGTGIQNPYASLTELNAYADNMELGYFTPGTWTFYVEIRNAGTKIYTGTTTPVYISTASKLVTVDMQLYTENNSTGSVTLKIAVPKANENAPDVTYSYSGAATGSGRVNTNPTADTTVTSTATGATGGSTNWYYFEKDITGLVPGNYVLVLNYLDQNEGNRIGGATVAFTVRNGDEYGVYGTIEDGEYQIATLLLNMPAVTISLAGSDSVSKHATETVTITATASAGATFAWYVNGAVKNGQTNSTFALSRANPGRFLVTCAATSSDRKLIAFAQHIVTVNP